MTIFISKFSFRAFISKKIISHPIINITISIGVEFKSVKKYTANVTIGRTINILRPIKENIYSQIYASYYINEKLRKKISKLAKGSSISNVYNSDLKTLEIKLPTLPEQQKIASFLSAVDEKIQQLRAELYA